ncbi:uncharacterized protein MEPE_01855 [Melanopsichium pennsylvanicum]|uniref:Wd40 repeat-like protein n=2 Tax=Melanopsichium pennsylvanicum TaxID=63383 RepID=A0AAJ4XIS7_9BASI|nr:wd40 repeat-containing protein l2dtl [Melanopsichium pennsylvanicum 4]SNX83149.1 uncharacterized protein MEPE_01855 [Melanopsichium pennsylvanicum]
MFSPPTSPSVLASTSRHNVIQPQQQHQQRQQRQQKSLRLFLGHQSDDDKASDVDFNFQRESDSDSDSQDGSLANIGGSRLQPGRLCPSFLQNTSTRTVSSRACDNNPVKRQNKRPRKVASSKKASIFSIPSAKQQAATLAAIPTTPTKRQKGLLIRGNVTPSRAFSIFKATIQSSQQRQQHGLMTPPTSSPFGPIVLDSCDSPRDDANASPSSSRDSRHSSFASPTISRSIDRSYLLSQGNQRLFIAKPSSFQLSSGALRTSAFAAGINSHPSVSQTLHAMRTRQSPLSSNGLLTSFRLSPAARPSTIDTTSFLETFVNTPFCHSQISRDLDGDVPSHPICAAYSYSSRSVNPSAQWLAVGDDEGRINLLNTLAWQDDSAQPLAQPQWQASRSSAIFEVVWRFDDRNILSGASDFCIKSWDTEYQTCTAEFEGHGGSPRSIVYDPTTNGDGGCGMVFASAGRDGTIRIWDARASERMHVNDDDGSEWSRLGPVLTIDAAHSTMVTVGTARVGKRGRSSARGKKRQPLPAGITALSYLSDGQGHKLLSGGSSNGIVKCWDLRHVCQRSQTFQPVSEVDTQKVLETPVSATWETSDLSLLTSTWSTRTNGFGGFKRAHGISQIISSSTSLYASCTGGKIYSLPLSTFLDSQLTQSEVQTLYDPVQCQNTLFSRMALFDDRFLAVGCNTGDIALWDVSVPRYASQIQNEGKEELDRDVEEERRAARDMQSGFAYRSQREGMAVLTQGHAKNTEVNAVAWANGPNGPTLSSVGDDTSIRTWYADRVYREHISKAAKE